MLLLGAELFIYSLKNDCQFEMWEMRLPSWHHPFSPVPTCWSSRLPIQTTIFKHSVALCTTSVIFNGVLYMGQSLSLPNFCSIAFFIDIFDITIFSHQHLTCPLAGHWRKGGCCYAPWVCQWTSRKSAVRWPNCGNCINQRHCPIGWKKLLLGLSSVSCCVISRSFPLISHHHQPLTISSKRNRQVRCVGWSLLPGKTAGIHLSCYI